jgi:hypothetical protein
MRERFELRGTVTALEQKRSRDGGALIPGFWSVKLHTSEGERSCSFRRYYARAHQRGVPTPQTHPSWPPSGNTLWDSVRAEHIHPSLLRARASAGGTDTTDPTHHGLRAVIPFGIPSELNTFRSVQ